jgi:hypothetical protein
VGENIEPVLSSEHDLFEWLPFDKARARIVWPGQRHGLETVHQCILSGEQSAGFSRVDI